jgi:hypothetical protein
MGADDASSAEMRRPTRPRHRFDPLALDDMSVDRLLTGALAPASAPPGYARVAELLAATVAAPTPRELAGQASVLAELRAVARTRSSVARPGPARPPRRRRRAGLAVVVVVGALATGGAAAATGHLPEPVRQAARSILASGGEPATPEPPEPAPVTTTGSGGAGPAAAPSTGAPGSGPGAAAAGSVAQPNLEGLCRAFLAGKAGKQVEQLDATAFEALSRAAGGDDQMRTFCQRLVPVDAKQKDPKEPKQKVPPGNEDHGQGGPPATTGGGQGQGSPSANQPSPAANPSGNDGTVKPR